MNRSILSAAGVLAVLAGVAQAGPIRTSRVAADAQWVVHVDMERINASPLGAMMRAEGGAVNLGDFDDVRTELGIDPLTDVRSVTLSGQRPDDEEPIIVIEATEALDNALARLPEEAGGRYHKIEDAGRTIHVLQDEDRTWFFYEKPGAEPATRILLVAPDMDRLREGMVRLELARDGANPPALRHGGPDAGSFVYFSTQDLPEGVADAGPASTLLRNASSVTVDVGESAGHLSVRALVDSVDPAQAQNVVQMAQGLLAMGKAMIPQDPGAARFAPILDAVTIGLEGDSLRLSVRAPITLIQELLADDAQEEGARAAGGEDDAVIVHRNTGRRTTKMTREEAAELKARIRAEVAERVQKEMREEVERRIREEVERELKEAGVERR